MTSRVLLATCAELPDGDGDDGRLLVDACRAHHLDVAWARWDDPDADWSGANLTVIRSTWDYTARQAEFVAWAAGVPRLANSAAVVVWNSDKRYLRDLERAGIAIVPTTWVGPGEPPQWPADVEFVVKPTVGAGSMGAGRFGAGQQAAAQRQVQRLHDAGRSVMVQPYLSDVDEAGETALVYLNGTFSHAVRKAPLLKPGVAHDIHRPLDGALFVPEQIIEREPSAAQLSLADDVLAAAHELVDQADPLLYARVDLLPSPAGPVLIELELTEPSLFLSLHARAADRFAAAIAARVEPT